MEMKSIDHTEDLRRALALQISNERAERPILEGRHGRVWNGAELAHDFEILGFAAPFVVVRGKAEDKLGSLMFQHHPRYYFGFREDT